MNREREGELIDILREYTHSEVTTMFLELFALRRERYRDRLEANEDGEFRGRAKECKDLLNIFG